MFKFKNIALATLLAVLPFSSHALDARYTDADGDLVADAPTDPKDWIDPDTLVFLTHQSKTLPFTLKSGRNSLIT